MNKTKLILIALIVTGFLIRTVAIGTNPVSLYWDEASIGYEAYSVGQTGQDMHGNSWLQAIFPAYGDFKAPVYIWLTSLTEKIWGPAPLAVRLPSAILGTLTIYTLFLIATHLSGQSVTGLFSAAALTFLPWHIQFSREGFEANAAVFFVSLCLYFALKSGREFDWRKNTLSSLFGLMAVYTYFSARIVVPLMIILTFIWFGKSIRQAAANLVLWAGIFIFGCIPLYLSPYAAAANQIRLSADNITQNQAGILYSNALSASDSFSWYGKLLHHRYIYLTKELIGNMASHFNADYLFFTGDSNQRHSAGITGLMLPMILPIFILGFLAVVKQGKIGLYLFGLWLIFLLPASVPREVPHALRSLNAVIPMSIILGLGASGLMHWSRGNKRQKIVLTVYGALLAVNFFVYTAYLHQQYPAKSNLAWQDGYPQLAGYIADQNDRHDYDYIVVTPGDRLFLYVLFYGHYQPESLQADLTLNQKDPLDFSVKQFGKITLRPIVWADDIRGPSRSLLIGNPGDFPPGVPIKDTITDTNGTVQFVSVDMGVL